MRRLGIVGLCLLLIASACGDNGEGAGPEATDATTPTSTEASGEVAGFTAGPFGAVEVGPGEEIQIRSLNSISGDVAFLGIPNQRGAELAIGDYGPVAGRSVSLGSALDDLCSPEGGQATAQALVADPSVVGVIGTTCSAAAVAASPLISDAGMVMIAPSNTSPALTSDLEGNPGTAYQPGYYRISHNDLFQGRAVALFVRNELGFARAAAIHDGDPYTQGLAQAFKDAYEDLGGEVTGFSAVNKGGSAAAVAASPLISDAGMVMIAPSNTSPALTSDLEGNPGTAYQPGYYRISHNDLFQGRAVALFVRNELGFARTAAIHDGDPYTQGLVQAFKDAYEDLGGEVTGFSAVNKGDTDMIAVLTEVAEGSPQALFFPIFMPEGGFIVQQVGSVPALEDVTLIVSAALLVDNFMELPESEGVYISGPDLRFGSNASSITGQTADGLLAAYVETYGEKPSAGYWGHAYDATTMLLRAIDRVAVDVEGTVYIDRQALRDELTGSSFDGIVGPIACDEFGDCGSQRITVIHHTDPRDIEAGKNNVVFGYAPTQAAAG